MEVTMMVEKHLEEEEEAHKLVGFYQGSLVRTVQYYKGLVVLMKLESEVILGMVVVLDLSMVLVEMMGILMVVSYLVLLVMELEWWVVLVVGLGWLGDKHV